LDNLVDTSAALNAVVFNCIWVVQRAGWNESFVRAIYTFRPKNPAVLAFCEAPAHYVFDATPRQQAMGAAVGMGALVELVRRPESGRGRARLREISEEASAAVG